MKSYFVPSTHLHLSVSESLNYCPAKMQRTPWNIKQRDSTVHKESSANFPQLQSRVCVYFTFRTSPHHLFPWCPVRAPEPAVPGAVAEVFSWFSSKAPPGFRGSHPACHPFWVAHLELSPKAQLKLSSGLTFWPRFRFFPPDYFFHYKWKGTLGWEEEDSESALISSSWQKIKQTWGLISDSTAGAAARFFLTVSI